MRFPTTPEHFEYFKERCVYWIEKLKCDDWDWGFIHGKLGLCLAQFDISYTGRGIDVTLNLKWNEPPTEKRLDRVAFHEVYEGGVLSTLRAYALMTISTDTVNEETHRIVRKMENFLLGYDTR